MVGMQDAGMRWRTLVSAEQLAGRVADPAIRIFDCRYELMQHAAGRHAFRAGHLPGARYADLEDDLSAAPTATSGRHPLPDPAAFVARLRAWDVNDDSQVVAYDAGNGMFAARLWWMLRWLGHESVAVLDGGLQRWGQLGLPIVTEVPPPGAGNIVGRPRPDLVVNADVVAAAAADPRRRVLDARAPERYRGEVEPIDAVGGHVPGARCHPLSANLGPDGRLLPPAELQRRLLASLEGTAAEHAIAMCGSGVTACHLLLAMEHAGLPGARLYPGSWSEWSRDPARAVAKGATP